MDPLRQDDLERARQTPAAHKLREALEMMQLGFDLKRASLRRAHPEASEDEIEQLIERWVLKSEPEFGMTVVESSKGSRRFGRSCDSE